MEKLLDFKTKQNKNTMFLTSSLMKSYTQPKKQLHSLGVSSILYTLYLTHGHHHSPDNLPPLEPGSVFLSGHTHVKLDDVRNGIRCLNPGSVSIPKDGSHSCLLYEDGVFRFRILEE